MPESQPQLFVTMSSVREDSCKRGVPADAVTFLLEANELAARVAPNAEHVHLIGDLSKVAENAAVASQTPQIAVDSLKKTLLGGSASEGYERQLRLFVDEKIKVINSICALFGRKIRVVSAIDFLRAGQSVAAADILNNLTMAYSDLLKDKTFDVEAMRKSCAGESLTPDHEPKRASLSDLAIATLPLRYRRMDVNSDKKLQHSFYSAAEGFLAAALINQGHIYASYRGSEVSRGSTIIENMRTFVQAYVYFVLKSYDQAKSIGNNFIIANNLDGVGFREEGGGVIRCFSCDPHTLDTKEGALRKLPFLPFDRDRAALHAVESSEFRSAIIDGTGGIGKRKMPVWLANLSPVGKYLDIHGSSDTVNDIWTRHSVSQEAVTDWRSKVERYLEAAAVHGKIHKSLQIDPLVPGANVDAICDLIHQMAEDIMKSCE